MPGNIVTGWLGDTYISPTSSELQWRHSKIPFHWKQILKQQSLSFHERERKTVTLAEFVSPFQNKTQPRQHFSPKPIRRQSPTKPHSLFNHWSCFKLDFSYRDFRSPAAAAGASRVKHGPVSPRGKESSMLQRAALNHYCRSVAKLSSGLLPAKRLPLECFRSCKFV